jgi:hypothetical protein
MGLNFFNKSAIAYEQDDHFQFPAQLLGNFTSPPFLGPIQKVL